MTSVLTHPAVAPGPHVAAPNRAALARVLLLCAAAIFIRLIVFTSRGDYVAYDEGWYLLLGRSLFEGAGFTLSGLQHTTLSPLFPVLAGLAGLVTNDVWAGRIVAALASGLLVLPCWYIFRRISGEPTAWSACILIAVMPSLAAFAAPYWIGWDLWVGAEPILHLLLFSAIALTLHARDTSSSLHWGLAGATFALAYLARPEAIIVFAITGAIAGVSAVATRSVRRTALALVMAAAFALTALPYWMYLHGALGRWALTGRIVSVAPAAADASATGTPRRGRVNGIEAMLWQNDNRQYVRELYGLDDMGTRLRSTYWGVPMTDAGLDSIAAGRNPDGPPRARSPINALTAPGADSSMESATVPENVASASPDERRMPSRLELYIRALGSIVPWFVWPFAIIGLSGRRSRPGDELLLAAPLVLTSIVIARVIGADPRTQLLIVPLILMYAARGVWLIDAVVERYAGRAADLRRGFTGSMATAVIGIGLVATIVQWVWMGLSMGSPHHTIGAANHRIGLELQRIVPAGEPVMSWHPAVALYAERDWRVLPYASLVDIVRYANAIDCDYIVLSRYYPGSTLFEQIDRDHLVLHVPADAPPGADGWWIDVTGGDESHAIGELRYAAPADGGE